MLAIISVNAPTPPENRGDARLPPITEVQREAIRHAQLDLQEASSWRKKARKAAYVPRLQLDYGYRMRNQVNMNVNENIYVGSSGVVVGPNDGNYSNNQYNDNSVGVRAIWDLGDTVFSTAVLAASAEARNVSREKNAILTEVDKRYYEIIRLPGELKFLRASLADDPNPAKIRHEIFLKGVACQESEAALDALTDGWFSAQLSSPVCETVTSTKKEKK